MNKILLLTTGCCLLIGSVFSQPQTNKVLADAQRKIDSLMNDPKMKQYKNMGTQVKMPTLPTYPTASVFAQKPDTAFLSKIKIAPRNNMLLALIPSKPLTRPQLIDLITDLKRKIMPALQEHLSTEILNVKSLGSSGASNAAALAWYKQRPDVAMELALDAADMDPDDVNALNNLSGILEMCGLGFKAISILEYIKQKDPGNSSVNNNLGQAYAGLGDQQKGAAYLKQALTGSPDHPNANLTLAYMSYANGDKGAAKNYCEHSLRGGFIPDAWNMLKSLDKKAKLMDLIRHRYKQPDFFNPHKYPLPEQCKTTDQLRDMMALYPRYKSMLRSVKDKYQKLLKTEQDYIRKNLADEVMKSVGKQKSPFRPYGAFATVVLGDIEADYSDKILLLTAYDSAYKEKYSALTKQYETEKKKLYDSFNQKEDEDGEGKANNNTGSVICKALNELSNQYLPQFAQLNEDRQREWIEQTKNYFNDYAFWCYMSSINDHQYHQLFYQLVLDYINMLEKLATTKLIGCTGNADTEGKDADFEFGEGKCPFNAEIPIANLAEEGKFEGFIGKISFDCEAFGVEFGEGLIFNYDRKLGTGETTLALGVGFAESIPFVHLLEGGAKMQFYVTLGGDTPLDLGIRWEAEMDVKGMNKPEQKAGWMVGINSGGPHFDLYSEGELPNRLSGVVSEKLFGLQPEQQVNPHVKVFNNSTGKKE